MNHIVRALPSAENNAERRRQPIKLLLVDDDPAFCHLCSKALDTAGIQHVVVGTAREALRVLENGDGAFDLILLDMELPGMSGTELLALLRDRGRDVPVVFVSVIDDVRVKVRSLDLGADDYIVKPFAFDELLARLATILRPTGRSRAVRFGDLEIDPSMRKTRCKGRQVDLAPREFMLLQVLAVERGAVLPPEELVRRAWKLEAASRTNALRVNISRLKHKLARTSRVRLETIRGLGYRLVDGAHAGR